MDLRPMELLLIFVVVGFLALVTALPIIGIVSAARIPESAWARAGKSKILWICLQAVPLVSFPPVALVVTCIYWLSIRRQVLTAAATPS